MKTLTDNQRKYIYAEMKNLACGVDLETEKNELKTVYCLIKNIDWFSLSDCPINIASDFIDFMKAVFIKSVFYDNNNSLDDYKNCYRIYKAIKDYCDENNIYYLDLVKNFYNKNLTIVNLLDKIVETMIDFGYLRYPLLEIYDDINKAIKISYLKNICLICGSSECDEHHIDRIGMGNNRNKVDDRFYRVCKLCRKHHSEWHSGGLDFFKKYNINYNNITITKIQILGG